MLRPGAARRSASEMNRTTGRTEWLAATLGHPQALADGIRDRASPRHEALPHAFRYDVHGAARPRSRRAGGRGLRGGGRRPLSNRDEAPAAELLLDDANEGAHSPGRDITTGEE